MVITTMETFNSNSFELQLQTLSYIGSLKLASLAMMITIIMMLIMITTKFIQSNFFNTLIASINNGSIEVKRCTALYSILDSKRSRNQSQSSKLFLGRCTFYEVA